MTFDIGNKEESLHYWNKLLNQQVLLAGHVATIKELATTDNYIIGVVVSEGSTLYYHFWISRHLLFLFHTTFETEVIIS